MTSFNKGKSMDNEHRDRADFNQKEEIDFESEYDGMAYSIFGDYFDGKEDKWWYNSVQDKLTKAKINKTPETFLSTSTLTIGIIGVILFVVMFFYLLTLFITNTINSFLLPLLFFTVIGSFVYTVVGYLLMYYYLLYKVSKRKTRLSRTFPYGVTFIYSLSKGGLTFPKIVEKLSESDDSYGEISREVKPIVKEMEYFSKDLPTTMRKSGRNTPLEKYNEFINDLVGIVDSGVSVSKFLQEKSQEYLDEIEREQREFLENLAVIAEIYVAGFLAAPLFILIVLIIMNMLQSGGVSSVALFVYGGLSFANIGFLLFISTYTPDDSGIKSQIQVDDDKISYEKFKSKYGDIKDESKIVDEIMKKKRRKQIIELIEEPKQKLMEKPELSLYVTVPISLFYILTILSMDFSTLTETRLYNNPVIVTTAYVTVPLVFMATPISIFHEIKHRQKNRLLSKLPGTFQQIAGTNSIGLNLSEGIDTVRDTTTGYLGEELRLVENDLRWNHDIERALKSFANRVGEPVMVRTVKLVTEANKSTGNIAEVLEVAAKDIKNTQKLKKDRKSEMKIYAGIIIISFVIYVFVVLSLNSSFFDRIEQLGQQSSGGAPSSVPGRSTSAFDLSSLPVDKYRTMFFHSAVIQGLGAGLIAGYLTADEMKSGIKYSIPLLIFATVAFFLFG